MWKTTFHGRQTLVEDDLRWYLHAVKSALRHFLPYVNEFKSDFNGLKHKVGLSNDLPNTIAQTQYTKPNLLNQIFYQIYQSYKIESTKSNLP